MNSVILSVNLYLFIITVLTIHLKENSTSVKETYDFAHQQYITCIWNCGLLAPQLNPSPRKLQTSNTKILCWSLWWPKARLQSPQFQRTCCIDAIRIRVHTVLLCISISNNAMFLFLSPKISQRICTKTAFRCFSYSFFGIPPLCDPDTLDRGRRKAGLVKEIHPPITKMIFF